MIKTHECATKWRKKTYIVEYQKLCGRKRQPNQNQIRSKREKKPNKKKTKHFEVSAEKTRRESAFVDEHWQKKRHREKKREKHSYIAGKRQVWESEKLVRFAIDGSTRVLVVTSFCLSSFAASFASLIPTSTTRNARFFLTQFNPLYAIYCSFCMFLFFCKAIIFSRPFLQTLFCVSNKVWKKQELKSIECWNWKVEAF